VANDPDDTPEITLSLPAEAVFAVTARTFAANAARHYGLDEETTEDLRLVASELFTNAVERRSDAVAFEIRCTDRRWEMRVEGIGALVDEDAEGRREGWFVGYRAALLETLVDRVEFPEDGVVVISVPHLD
jgi:anti-sigma regulatory factor (Ser/Thr protein kinase)